MSKTALAAVAFVAVLSGAAQAADVGVSVAVSQPGFYGRIEIGGLPPPIVVYPQPMIAQPAPVAVVRRPIHLHVPPGHARNWSRHCHHYQACSQPVMFVADDWYQTVYVPARHGLRPVALREHSRFGDRDAHHGHGGHGGHRPHGGHGGHRAHGDHGDHGDHGGHGGHRAHNGHGDHHGKGKRHRD